jgi:hypothetical protein
MVRGSALADSGTATAAFTRHENPTPYPTCPNRNCRSFTFAYPAKANLITNGGFETGDLTSWNHTGEYFVAGTLDGISPHSGNYQGCDSGGDFSGAISQAITTTPGTAYTINFFLAAGQSQGLGGTLILSWGGNTVFNHLFTSAFGYTEYTFNVPATNASTFLLFDFEGSEEFFLDDVSVEPTGVGVPDGGTTVSLLGCALLGLAGLRRKLGW